MPYSKGNYPSRISALPSHAQDIWVSAFNNASKTNSEEASNKIAWGAVKNAGYKKDKDKWIKASENFYYSVLLSENMGNQLEIMRTGKWKHPLYGLFEITENTLTNIITNFENKVRGIDISFDLEHGGTSHKGEAVCWVKKLFRKGSSLLAEVDWTDFGKKKVQEKSFRYFSPEFKFIYTDSETGKKYNNVLLGGGLTNRPFIKNMSPIMLSENIEKEFTDDNYIPCKFVNDKEEIRMNPELLKALQLSEDATETQIATAVNKLVEDTRKLSESESTISTLKAEKVTKDAELESLKTEKEALNIKLTEAINKKTSSEKEIIALTEAVNKMELKFQEQEWETISTVALSEGKMTPAMVESFKAQFRVAPDVTKKIIDCLQPVVKLDEKGSAAGANEVSNLKLFEQKITENMKSEKLDYVDAMEFTEKHEPSLFKLADLERRGLV